jgi:hypothetical protein
MILGIFDFNFVILNTYDNWQGTNVKLTDFDI